MTFIPQTHSSFLSGAHAVHMVARAQTSRGSLRPLLTGTQPSPQALPPSLPPARTLPAWWEVGSGPHPSPPASPPPALPRCPGPSGLALAVLSLVPHPTAAPLLPGRSGPFFTLVALQVTSRVVSSHRPASRAGLGQSPAHRDGRGDGRELVLSLSHPRGAWAAPAHGAFAVPQAEEEKRRKKEEAARKRQEQEVTSARGRAPGGNAL